MKASAPSRFAYANVGIEPSLIELIDSYREATKIGPRSAATRALIIAGLAANGMFRDSEGNVVGPPPFAPAVPILAGGKFMGWVGEL